MPPWQSWALAPVLLEARRVKALFFHVTIQIGEAKVIARMKILPTMRMDYYNDPLHHDAESSRSRAIFTACASA